ncbi:hypothetical protein MPH_01037 [Macrophomina phaseolina MS6]|uniref:Uncharacterized protein n=1 Tax=Macrophomina phaseolina (strain MS6) TaxID=1126212 RepID=K2SYH6_MACPH|nr:hypothetical protein MPH_01037 [Macrophomina phaseolina MS6]
MDHSSGQEYRNACQDMFADCMACIARKIFCRAAAKINLPINVDTELQCTATAQHCYANVDCRYTCEASFQTCFGGADAQHCTRQKEMWDSCASKEEYCRYGPGQDNKQALCMLVARECYWNALLLK